MQGPLQVGLQNAALRAMTEIIRARAKELNQPLPRPELGGEGALSRSKAYVEGTMTLMCRVNHLA